MLKIVIVLLFSDKNNSIFDNNENIQNLAEANRLCCYRDCSYICENVWRMKSLVEYKELLSGFKKEFGPRFGIRELGIFGSVARGEQTEASGLDVFVSLEKVEPFILFDLRELLETLCKCKVDLVRLRDSLRPSLKQSILKDGVYV